MDEEGTEIIMTPTKKGKTTRIKIEKKKKIDFEDKDMEQRHHVAGGEHKGLVINKSSQELKASAEENEMIRANRDDEEDMGKPQVQLGFNCFLVDKATGTHVVESRRLKFWYVETADYLDQVTTGFNFFRELLKPENFPKDYVGFIRRCMKQMQKPDYNQAKKINIEIEQLDDDDMPLSPDDYMWIINNPDGADELLVHGRVKEDTRSQAEIVYEKLLQVLESAYPNILAMEDLLRIIEVDEAVIAEQLQNLQSRGLVQQLENGGFVRHVLDEKTEVQDMKQMATVTSSSNQQPTIAVITANYCEKLAVDAMMENKTTYVKWKTGGESNAYTIGFIGEHKVVSIKLPMIGHGRAAQISSGNTTTRLLGTFQAIEHVFVVGVGGGVPHFTDYYKHPRLGDVVISDVRRTGNMYYHCDKVLQERDGSINYSIKGFCPKDLFLQDIADKIQEQLKYTDFRPWQEYIGEGLELLSNQEADYNRPDESTDRLTMMIGDGNVLEVQHPVPQDGIDTRQGMPKIHLGVMGSGKRFARADDLRMDFAAKYGVNVFDTEFDQVLESIVGNVKDSYMFIRGISDYQDGSQKLEWQPYAALAAASVMKFIIRSFNNQHLCQTDID